MSALCCACGQDRKDVNPACVWCLFHDILQADCPPDTSAQQCPALASSAEDGGRSARLQARNTSIT